MLAALWRMRVLLATLLVLWTIGLARGGHPSRRLSRLGPRRGRLDLVHAGVRRSRSRSERTDKAATGSYDLGLVFLTDRHVAFCRSCCRHD